MNVFETLQAICDESMAGLPHARGGVSRQAASHCGHKKELKILDKVLYIVCNECHNALIPKHNASNARPSVLIKVGEIKWQISNF